MQNVHATASHSSNTPSPFIYSPVVDKEKLRPGHCLGINALCFLLWIWQLGDRKDIWPLKATSDTYPERFSPEQVEKENQGELANTRLCENQPLK